MVHREPPELISVIVPARDAEATIGQQLDALAGQSCLIPFEVVVADDGSTDDTIRVVLGMRDRFSRLRIVSSSRPRGTGAARSAGARAASGDLFAFCDSDDVVTPGWLDGLLDVVGDADLVGGPVESGMINPPESESLRGPSPNRGLQVGMRFLPTPLGGNTAVWRTTWEALGGFDPRWKAGDDWEFAFRAQLAGFRLVYAPDAVVHYRYRTGVRKSMAQRFRFGRTQARLYATFRHDGLPQIGLRRGIRVWGSILWHLRDLAGSPRTRGRYLMRVAQHAGRLTGSLRYRTLYL